MGRKEQMAHESEKLKTLLLLAESLQRVETDPQRNAFWFGYIQGIRRALHGETYGTATHNLLHEIPEDDPDENRREMGKGYRAGFRGECPEELF